MKLKLDISLVGATRLKLQRLGEKIDENKENDRLYVAWSCNLIDDGIIGNEIVEYMDINRPNIFDSKALNNIANNVLNKHVLNESSEHTIKNAEEVFRRD